MSYRRLVSEDLVQIAEAPARRHRLTLVYDQSYDRNHGIYGNREQQVRGKLDALRGRGIYGAAYVSHAVFIWVSATKCTTVDATRRLRRHSRLPVTRFIGDGA